MAHAGHTQGVQVHAPRGQVSERVRPGTDLRRASHDRAGPRVVQQIRILAAQIQLFSERQRAAGREGRVALDAHGGNSRGRRRDGHEKGHDEAQQQHVNVWSLVSHQQRKRFDLDFFLVQYLDLF